MKLKRRRLDLGRIPVIRVNFKGGIHRAFLGLRVHFRPLDSSHRIFAHAADDSTVHDAARWRCPACGQTVPIAARVRRRFPSGRVVFTEQSWVDVHLHIWSHREETA